MGEPSSPDNVVSQDLRSVMMPLWEIQEAHTMLLMRPYREADDVPCGIKIKIKIKIVLFEIEYLH